MELDLGERRTSRERNGRRKRILLIGTVLLVIMVIAVVAIMASQPTSSTTTAQVVWEGNCPKEATCPKSYQGRPPPLLLVSLDGFRPDYLARRLTPTLERLSRCGATAKSMFPVFPTKTFPNHFTLVTGLYPSSHGIIGNKIFDPVSGTSFRPGNDKSFWWEKEPIWVTAVKQGKKSATFYWPGSDIKINGTYPTYYKPYNKSVPFKKRVKQMLSWLDLPVESRPSLLTMYLSQPDGAAHIHGIHSKQVNEALVLVDGVIEQLLSGLQKRNLTNCVNVFIMSDHGMSDIDCNRTINIKPYVNSSDIISTSLGPIARLRSANGNKTMEENILSALKCQDQHMRVYKKEELPLRMHYSEHQRIEPIILDADSGWSFVRGKVAAGDFACTGGNHGYDNYSPDMKAFFTALGPSIKRNITVEPFINIELYELMCELIDITPEPNNGTRGSLHHLLKVAIRPLPPTNETHLPPETSKVPETTSEYTERIEAAQCPCPQSHKQVDMDNHQDELHAPFGLPHLVSPGDGDNLRLLRNTDYIVAYSPRLLMPRWAAFTIQRTVNISDFEDVCWMGDARIPSNETVNCGTYDTLKKEGIFQRPLYPPAFSNYPSKEEAFYVTNSVPKSRDHVDAGLEEAMQNFMVKWAKRGPLTVMTGPVFHGNDLAEVRSPNVTIGNVVVPSHFFVIVTWCSVSTQKILDCDHSHLDVNAFLLPNAPFANNCQSAEKEMEMNTARVVDIEKVTGLTFFVLLPTYEAIRLRTSIPHGLAS